MGLSGFGDEELMVMFRYGDGEAFEELFARHADGVYRYARHLVGHPHAAEDVAQETFLALVEAAGRYEPRSGFRSFLYTLAHHRAVSALRRRREVLVEMPAERPDPRGVRVADAETAEDAVRAEAALRTLPDEFREAFLLREVEGLSAAEAAEVLGCPETTVRTRCHRARGLLARALGVSEDGR